ncbi:hypothetical protein, partial [Streptosporangium sp. OZ121]|uniref:hypothetical protein n=1 Tax=Streptosporangium sp. OZ121 TaxID=3444183 RepID=UPI003F7B2573
TTSSRPSIGCCSPHNNRCPHFGASPPERRGRLYTDLARAWWQWGKPEQTATALLNAFRQSADEVRARPSIRAMAVTLIDQHPRVAGVQTLAVAIGHRR